MEYIKSNKFHFVLICLLVVSSIFSTSVFGADTVPEFLKEKKYDVPLQFVGISIKKLEKHSVIIEWETNHPASGRIELRSKFHGTQQVNKVSSVKKHRLQLTGVKQGTKYTFQVYSWDNSGHRIKSQVVAFKTNGTPPPRFKRIFLKKLTLSGGIIRWVTNIPTTAVFESGYDTNLKYTTKQKKLTRYHQVELDNFHPNQRIRYRITIEDSKERTKSSGIKSFTTREDNVAWNKPVKGTFDEPIFGVDVDNRGQTPFIQRVNDDVLDYQYGTANSGDPSDTTQWFQIDLNELYAPDTAVLIWRSFSYPKQYKISASINGKTWDTLAGDLNAASGIKTRAGGIPSYKHVVDLPSDKLYRHIKVTIPKNAPYYGKYPSYNFVQLQEFKLFPKRKFRSKKENQRYKQESETRDETN